jgi:uncharacterized protein (DUF1697 family)
MARYVALLRGINVGGHRKVPMADLRSLAEDAGLTDARTYVASGNLVFSAERKSESALEALLEKAIETRFGFDVDVLVRAAEAWDEIAAANPFPEDSQAAPSKVMATIGRRPATDADVESLRPRATENEKVARSGGVLWFYYGDGSGRSKLAAAPIQGLWTTRNWRTVETLQAMLRAES